ncbi:hypothetical protein GCM10009099_14750 [Caenispirillum bisanense]
MTEYLARRAGRAGTEPSVRHRLGRAAGQRGNAGCRGGAALRAGAAAAGGGGYIMFRSVRKAVTES